MITPVLIICVIILVAFVPYAVVAQTVNSTSCDISIPNNPCIKQFHATPAMCERAKVLNETTPTNSTNMTAIIEKGVAQMFMEGQGHCLSK